MFFQVGDVYDRQQILDVLEAKGAGYLPLKEDRVAAGLFDAATEATTHFSGEIDVFPKRLVKGAKLLRDGEVIPVFLKISPKQWRYAGKYRFVRLAKDKGSIEKAEHELGRDDIAAVLKFEPVEEAKSTR